MFYQDLSSGEWFDSEAHRHTCPDCGKEFYCSLDQCSDRPCEDCSKEDCDEVESAE